jgi:hypothetical protein
MQTQAKGKGKGKAMVSSDTSHGERAAQTKVLSRTGVGGGEAEVHPISPPSLPPSPPPPTHHILHPDSPSCLVGYKTPTHDEGSVPAQQQVCEPSLGVTTRGW